MKQAFPMKTMLLSALLCAAGFGSKAQIADCFNSTPCNVIVRFTAIDPATCAVLAFDPTTYTIPAGASPLFVPPAWIPGPPASPYWVEAEVADAACGFPGVIVGPGGPCGPVPTAPLPPCPSCPASVVDNPSPIFPPGGGGMHWPVNIH